MFRYFRTWLTKIVRDIVRQEIEKLAIPDPGKLTTTTWEINNSIDQITLDINKINRRIARIEAAMGKAGIAPALGDSPEEY